MGKKDPFRDEQINEDIVGTVQVSKDYSNEPTPVWGTKRFLCARCRDGYHNTPDDDIVCRGNPCKCRCRTHYIGRDGRLRPYGAPDDSDERLERESVRFNFSKESLEEFERILEPLRNKECKE